MKATNKHYEELNQINERLRSIDEQLVTLTDQIARAVTQIDAIEKDIEIKVAYDGRLTNDSKRKARYNLLILQSKELKDLNESLLELRKQKGMAQAEREYNYRQYQIVTGLYRAGIRYAQNSK